MSSDKPFATIKFLSVEDANRALFIIRPIVVELTNSWADVSSKIDKLQELKLIDSDEDIKVLLDKISQIERIARDIDNNVDELEEIGCFVENFNEGIIDIPSTIDGEKVMLCWSLGEEEISHYHKPGELADKRLLIKQIIE